MPRRCFTLVLALALTSLLIQSGMAQGGPALPELLRGIDRLGTVLTEELWKQGTSRNIVVAPSSVAALIAAIHDSSTDLEVDREVRVLLGTSKSNERVAVRMLLAGMPELPPGDGSPAASTRLQQGAWIRNRLVVQLQDSPPGRFLASGRDFGITIERPDGDRGAGAPGGVRSGAQVRGAPAIASSTYLRTAWYGNTFVLSRPFQASFATASGQSRLVEMLTSEGNAELPFVETDRLRAAVLPGETASVLVAVPTDGHTVGELIDLVATDEFRRSLRRQRGFVELPTFSFTFHAALRPVLEDIGLRSSLKALDGIASTTGGPLTRINQSTHVAVDRLGIRADADVVGGKVYGYSYGTTLGSPPPFRLRLDRPYVFVVRDNATDALLLMGIVADPGAQTAG